MIRGAGRPMLGLAVMLAAGCVTGQQPAEQAGYVACQAPRPEVCPMHYDPVCGERGDGSRHTYSNGCQACADVAVVGYRPDACPGKAPEAAMEQKP